MRSHATHGAERTSGGKAKDWTQWNKGKKNLFKRKTKKTSWEPSVRQVQWTKSVQNSGNKQHSASWAGSLTHLKIGDTTYIRQALRKVTFRTSQFPDPSVTGRRYNLAGKNISQVILRRQPIHIHICTILEEADATHFLQEQNLPWDTLLFQVVTLNCDLAS